MSTDTISVAVEGSSNVKSFTYNETTQDLRIQFLSGLPVYRFCNVEKSIVVNFIAASSKGQYFSKFIRGKYAFEQES